MNWSALENESQIATPHVLPPAANDPLTTLSRFEQLPRFETHGSGAGLYQAIARSISMRVATNQSAEVLAARLASIADHGYVTRQFDVVGCAGKLLLNLPLSGQLRNAGHYYQALSLHQGGRGDRARMLSGLETVADRSSARYRAKAMLALGSNFFRVGDLETANAFYREVMRIVKLDRLFDPMIAYGVSRMIAVMRGTEGDHRGAANDLERMLPLARMASSQQPYAFYDYLNTLAVELTEVGRLGRARRASEIALASSFSQAYPEWLETWNDIASRQLSGSRSTIGVSGFKSEPASAQQRTPKAQLIRRHAARRDTLFRFPYQERLGRPFGASAKIEPDLDPNLQGSRGSRGSQARVLDFQQWKRRDDPSPVQLTSLSPEQRMEMTTGEKLIRLMDLISHDDTDDETIDVILEAVEAIVLRRRGAS